MTITAPRVVAVFALGLAVAAGVLWLVGSNGTLSATGLVRTTEAGDTTAAAVLASGACGATSRSAGATIPTRPGDPIVLITVDWELSGNPADNAKVRLDVDAPDGWIVAGCRPAGTLNRGSYTGSAGQAGAISLVYAPAEPRSIPDLQPWSATIAVVTGEGPQDTVPVDF